jgi:hypothetical protein
VVEQNVYWLAAPISPGKSRSFTVKAKLSKASPTNTTSISTLAYILDTDDDVVCASVLANAPVSYNFVKILVFI